MDRERRWYGFSSRASAVIAGLLTVLLFSSVALSAAHGLHQSLHRDGSIPSHQCLLCSVAHGQVNAVDVAWVSVAVLLFPLLGLRLADISVASRFDYRLSPSRAPPCS